jgi:hypothetical protein
LQICASHHLRIFLRGRIDGRNPSPAPATGEPTVTTIGAA